MRPPIAIPMLLAMLAASVPEPAAAAIGDEIIVKRVPALDAAERRTMRADARVGLVRALPLRRVDLVRVAEGTRSDALRRLNADPSVVWAEPNHVRRVATSDALWPQLWSLENTGQPVEGVAGEVDADIDVPQAWQSGRGQGVTVAVIDSGVEFSHPDLEAQLTGNPGEQGGGREDNGRDDDANGFVDDWRGWDFVGDDGDPADGHGHGTHVSGTIAAREDSGGVVGVAPDARVLAIRALGDEGEGSTADVIEAIDYAGDLGMKVVNMSVGAEGSLHSEREALAAHPGTLFVVAAGNEGRSAHTTFPCAYPEPNVVCVGASTSTDQAAWFSNHGPSVELFAPGVSIVSSVLEGSHEYADGTSMAAPHVAGVAALLWSRIGDSTVAQVRSALTAGADPKESLSGFAASGSRLNAAGALQALESPRAEPQPAPPRQPPPPSAGTPANGAASPAPPLVISGLTVHGRPVICASRSRGCRSRAGQLRFRASGAGILRIELERRRCQRRCAWRPAGTAERSVPGSGVHALRIERRLAGLALRPGRWRVTLRGGAPTALRAGFTIRAA